MSRVRRELARLMVFFTLWTIASGAWGIDVPSLTGRVVDLAHVLPASTVDSLSAQFADHEAKTSNQVAVLIIPSLDGDALEEFSHRVATTWRLGQKGTDNGVLLLVVPQERKLRIEVGYGLEGVLTDARSAQIIRNIIVPRFRAGDLPGGITAGVQAIVGTIEGTNNASDVQIGRHRTAEDPTAFEYVIIGIIVGTLAGMMLSHGLQRTRAFLGAVLAFLVAQSASIALGLAAAGVTAFLLWLMLQSTWGGRTRGRGPDFMWGPGGGWDGGSFGNNIGFGGGGGDFGGGGASGRWS